MNPVPVRVCIVDDDALARQAIMAYLNSHDGFVITAVYTSGEEAVPAIIAEPPDVVLMDLRMRGMSGLTAMRRIAEAKTPTRLLAVTTLDDHDTAARVLSAGGSGYVVKSVGPELESSIRAVHEGLTALPDDIARSLADSHSELHQKRISEDELRVLELVGDGLTNRQIAQRMHTSLSTVKNRVSGLRQKFGLHSRAQMVAEAERYRDPES